MNWFFCHPVGFYGALGGHCYGKDLRVSNVCIAPCSHGNRFITVYSLAVYSWLRFSQYRNIL